MADLGQAGVLQVIPPAALEQQLQERAQQQAQAQQSQQQPVPELAGYIKGQWEIFRNHRNTVAGWSERMLAALRTYNGQYSPSQAQDIKKFGGSDVYARLVTTKCRAASSLLRDIYLGPDRPWSIRPNPDPDIPDEIIQKINILMQQEAQMVAQTLGRPPSQEDMDGRRRALMESAQDAAVKKAKEQGTLSENKIEEILRDGGFYTALAEFIVDLPIFPFACIKGPVVRIVPTITWPPGGGPPVVKQVPKLTWERVSPFDLWWTPGVADIANAAVIEKSRITRAEINDWLDIPGFNVDEVRAVLDEYGRGGLYDNWDTTDAERSVLENRENPAWNRSQLISIMEYNGNVQGRILQDYGLAVPDELRDYHIQAWVIGSHVVKANLSPSPRQRHPYFITSFEKVPGTPIGNGLTDLIADMQDVANATLRALVNNLAISSGPQYVINTDRLMPDENPEDIYPNKRWRVRNDPVGANNRDPITFFQPESNSTELINVFKTFQELADDISAIPKYVGGQAGSGAGRTAAGLAMLMGNASKILQTVSANIDRDIVEAAFTQLGDMILLTDTTGLLTGEEKFSVQGVQVAMQRETLRQRQIEFLQTTANPTDLHIMGISGRGKVLRSVSSTIGLDGQEVVPNDDALDKLQQQQLQQQQTGPTGQAVQQGVIKGVQAGVTRIATELTAGGIAAGMQVPEGPPVHIGTPPPGQGGPPGVPAPPGGPPPGSPAQVQMTRQAQGNKAPAPTQGGPQTHLLGGPGQSTPGAVPNG